jgi:hypothetical protein
MKSLPTGVEGVIYIGKPYSTRYLTVQLTGKKRQKYWPERTPHSLQKILTDAQKTSTAAKLMLSTALLHQFGRVKRGTPVASVRMLDQD